MWFRPACALCLALVLGLPCASSAGGPLPEESAAYSRDKILPLVSKPGKQRNLFSAFKRSTGATWNKNFWGASLGFDQFTGIGWETERAGVLVTPEHVISAGHYGNNKQNGVHFYDARGEFLGHRAIALDENGKALSLKLPNDMRVSRLSAPAPAGARIYPLPDPATHEERIAWSALPKSQRPILLAVDWRNPRPKKTDDPAEKQRWRTTRSVHPVTLAAQPAAGQLLNWSYGPASDPAIHPSYHEVVNVGDSSQPIFWVTRSGLVLASTFTATSSGPNYGSPANQEKIQAAIDRLGGQEKYTLKTVPVP